MSGYQRPRTHSAPAVKLPRLPDGQNAEIINGAFVLLERADAQNAKNNLEPAFPSVLLQAPDGSTYRLSVAKAPAPYLVLTLVPPRSS
jgi:hypothetical protein